MSDETKDTQPIINIEGEKVPLGPLRRDLITLYTRWFNDFTMLRSIAQLPRPMTLEEETARFDRVARGSDRDAAFTLYESATWQPIGTLGLHGIDERNRTAWMGIVIGEPNARGKGYGTEATRLMLDYAFTARGLHNVMLTVYAFNIAGMRAYQKAGFKEFGRRRESKWLGGRWWDEVYMDALASEFTSPMLARIFVPDESH